MTDRRLRPTQVVELAQYGRTFRARGRIVLVRCDLVTGPHSRRFEVTMWANGSRAVVDVPGSAEAELPRRIATAADAPQMDCIIVESDEPNGPFGAKEVGEGGIMPTIPAILNAIFNATGVRVTELPVTPERMKKALAAAPNL